MAILRITLDSWRDLGEQEDTDGVAGSPLTGRATMTPSLDGGGVLTSDAYHSRLTEQATISELPWSHVLVDPTHAMPTGWGWTVTLTPDGFASRPAFAVLDPETIEAIPQVDGVRTIRLEDHLGLADTLGAGGLVRPLPGEPGPPGRGVESIAPDGLVTYTDGTTDRLTLPEGAPGRSVVSITAEAGASEATVLYSDGTSAALSLPRGPGGETGPAPVVGWDGTRLVVDGEPGPDLRGEPGPAPEPSSVTASAVTLPPGSAASAEVVGDWPDLDYRIGVPQGVPGPAGRQGPPGAVAAPEDYQIIGPGRPDVPATTSGTITGSEPTGCMYVSTDGAGVGAWTWRKRPTGWTVETGSTGWRELVLEPAPWSGQASVKVARSGATVILEPHSPMNFGVWRLGAIGAATLSSVAFFLPGGWRPSARVVAPIMSGLDASAGEIIGAALISPDAQPPAPAAVKLRHPAGHNGQVFSLRWETRDPWPATLPGTPIT